MQLNKQKVVLLVSMGLLVTLGLLYYSHVMQPDSSFTKRGVIATFRWNGKVEVLDIRDQRTGRSIEDGDLREAVVGSASVVVPPFAQESRLRQGKGELGLTLIGYGRPYLPLHPSVKITEPDLEALIEAAGACKVEAVQKELAAGNEPNAREPRFGATALIYAAACPDSSLVKLLLAAGANPNDKDGLGKTALMYSKKAAMEALLAAGADVNARHKYRGTALMSSAYYGRVEEVKLLIAAGADVDARNEFGDSALDEAEQRGHVEIARLLRQAGATDKTRK